jgi:hypothetical protein
MNEILNTAIKYSSELPTWFGSFFWPLIAIFLVLKVVMAILKIVRNPIFCEFSKGVVSFLRLTAPKFFAGAFSQLESPIERPRTKLVMKVLSLIHTYLMAIIFFFLFALVVVGILMGGLPNAVTSQLGILGVFTFFFYMAVFFRAQADRDYLDLKKYWHECEKRRNNT